MDPDGATLPPFARRAREALSQGRRAVEPGRATRAGVLAALFAGPDGEPRVWLIRRPDALRSHAGQVALPGGKHDPTDIDLIATALREADEEIGLPVGAVTVLGAGDDLVTSTGYVITPVVGWLAAPFTPRPNALEVARAFSAPFATFRGEGMLGLVPIASLRDLARAYRVDGELVWGATAQILRSLASRLPA